MKANRFSHIIAAIFPVLALNALATEQCEKSGTSLKNLQTAVQECVLPAVGESRLVSLHKIFRGQSYRVKRLESFNDKDRIEISFPVRYLEARVQGSGTKKKEDPQFRQFVQHCLDDYWSSLRGPNGEMLQLRAADPSEFPKSPLAFLGIGKRPTTVARTIGLSRTNSKNYDALIDCKDILHETLHLLGLVDEYPEAESPMACRSLGPENSIMYNQDVALAEARGGCLAEGFLLDPTPELKDADAVRDLLQAGGNPKGKPGGLFLPPYYNTGCEGWDVPELERKGGQVTPILYVKYRNQPALHTSLLKPAHFRKIVYPGCQALNAVYDQCSRDAYRKESNPKRCPAKPEVCKSPTWLDQ